MNRFILIAICSLSHSLYSKAQETKTEVIVFDKDGKLPDGAKNVGSIKIGDNMRTNCGYSRTLEQAKEKARALGANIIRITEVKEPNGFSSCYRIKATAYYYGQVASLHASADSFMATLLPPTANYALLYIYRTKSYRAPINDLLNLGYIYDVHINGNMYHVFEDVAYIVRINTEGELNVWAKTEKRKEAKFNIQFGKAYFLECSAQTGLLGSVPDLRSVGIIEAYPRFLECQLSHAAPEPEPLKQKEKDDVYK